MYGTRYTYLQGNIETRSRKNFCRAKAERI